MQKHGWNGALPDQVAFSVMFLAASKSVLNHCVLHAAVPRVSKMFHARLDAPKRATDSAPARPRPRRLLALASFKSYDYEAAAIRTVAVAD